MSIGGSRGTHASSCLSGSPYYVSWGDWFATRARYLETLLERKGNAPIADNIGIHVNEPSARRGSTVVWVWRYAAGRS